MPDAVRGARARLPAGESAEHPAGAGKASQPLLVIAGAGSGKTNTWRIASPI